MNREDLLKSYNESGLAAVLDGAHNLIKRAADLYREMRIGGPPPAVQAAWRKEVDVCLAEAEELIAAVRKARP